MVSCYNSQNNGKSEWNKKLYFFYFSTVFNNCVVESIYLMEYCLRHKCGNVDCKLGSFPVGSCTRAIVFFFGDFCVLVYGHNKYDFTIVTSIRFSIKQRLEKQPAKCPCFGVHTTTTKIKVSNTGYNV